MCNINGLKDHSTRHQMDVSDQCKTYRKSQELPLGTFAFRIPLKRRGLSLSEFGVRMSQLSPGLLVSVHRTIQTYGPPAHLLRLVHPAVHQEVGRALGQRRANPQPGPVPLAVVDQPIALPDEVAVQRPQRGPQLARGRDGPVAAALVPEVVQDRADAIDADLRILSSAVPQPPAQALDLLDDHRLRGRALRTIG